MNKNLVFLTYNCWNAFLSAILRFQCLPEKEEMKKISYMKVKINLNKFYKKKLKFCQPHRPNPTVIHYEQ